MDSRIDSQIVGLGYEAHGCVECNKPGAGLAFVEFVRRHMMNLGLYESSG